VHRAIENTYYDWWHVLAGARYAPAHTAVVLIDDATFLTLKDDPLAFWAPFVVVGEGNAGWGSAPPARAGGGK
jgi:hypothetical protein